MERLFSKLCMLIVVALALQMHGNKGCLEKERIALLAIKPFIINAVSFYGNEDDHNRIVESWVDDRVSNCCDWYRVECNTTGRVMNLSLSGLLYHESTTILNFSWFQPFEQLQILDLSHNYFKGWVDGRAHHLKQLKILNLGYNSFNGSILSYLTSITSLTTLILNQNNLTDFNPTRGGGLGNLKNLEYLDLSETFLDVSLQELDHHLKQLRILNLGGNNFNGRILSYLTAITSLTTLILYGNNLEDFKHTQGRGLKNLRNLEYLDLCSTSLNVSLQELGLANLTNLEHLDLSYNEGMSGSLQELGAGLANLTNLKFLDLSEAGMNGSLQELGAGLANLTNLEHLDLSYNYGMSGSLQELGLANLTNLEFLDLSGNYIRSGSLQQAVNLRNLKFLDLSYNRMIGSLQELGICKLKNLIELDLSDNNFEGHLPPCVNNFTILRALDLSSNQLTGNIPSLNLLSSLKYLTLQSNNFEGPFSFGSLANLSKLEIFKLSTEDSKLRVLETENFLQPPNQLKFLSLSECNLHVIPSFLMYQHSLEFIDLSHNKLVGMVPTWLLQNNTRLQGLHLINISLSGILQLPNSTHHLLELRISNNNLNGQLPVNIAMILPRLVILDLSKNTFEGCIPSSMGEMKSLNALDLSSNNFSGELPKPFLSGCPSLGFLKLSYNNFHGEIFPEFMNMTQLQFLKVDNNQFGGKIQDRLLKARLLEVLDLSSNRFSGQIPAWIGNLSYLDTLVLSNNILEGVVPVQLSNLKDLEFLDISENRLSGSMASSFNLSSYVQHIYMQKNALSGSIPNTFFRSPNLVTLDLRDNKFSGSIPSKIDDKLTILYFLLLGGNRLEGNIPHELCNFKNLSILDLSHNRLSGPVPSCFSNMPFWAVEDGYSEYRFSVSSIGDLSNQQYLFITSYNFTLSFQLFMEPMPESYQELQVGFVTKNRNESYEGSILSYMTGLDLSSNELTGDIPSEIGYLRNIRAINLSHNSLSGSIPESFSNLKNIESLDLSQNQLSGRIPPQLTQLNSLAIFNVSNNSLSGTVPDKGQFGTFVESSYGGNPDLCGSQIKRSCGSSEPTTPSGAGEEEEEDESAIDMVSFYWSLFAAYVTTIMAFVLILWLNSDWRKQWFCFIDACIISSYCWILRNVFHRYDDI